MAWRRPCGVSRSILRPWRRSPRRILRLSPLVAPACYGLRGCPREYPNRNIQLHRGEQIIKRHDGAPKPAAKTPVDPNLKSWSVHLIGGRKTQHLGFIQADGERACDRSRRGEVGAGRLEAQAAGGQGHFIYIRTKH